MAASGFWREYMRRQRAVLVYRALRDLTDEANPGPNQVRVIKPHEVATRVGVSVAQAKEAIEDLREEDDREEAIITILGHEGGWVLTVREDLIRWFMRWRTQQAYTIMRRTYFGAVRPFLTRVLRHSQPEVAQELGDTFEHGLEKLRAALAVA